MLDSNRPATSTGAFKMFGDGVTDDSDALQLNLDTYNNVYLDARRNYKITKPIYFRREGQVLESARANGTGIVLFGNATIHINGQHGTEIRNIRFFGKNGSGFTHNPGVFAITVDTAGTPLANAPGQLAVVSISHVNFDGCGSGILARDVNTLRIDNVNMADMQGIGILASALNNNQRIDIVELTRFNYNCNSNFRTQGAGTAIIIDGNVQGFTIERMRAVGCHRGILVQNSANLPFGSCPAFLLASGVEIDFPYASGVYIDMIDSAHFTDMYCHGSVTDHGIVATYNTKDLQIIGGKITGHNQCAVYFDGNGLQMAFVNASSNSQGGRNNSPAVFLANNAREVAIVGGTTLSPEGGLVSYGIFRENPNLQASVAAIGLWRGNIAPHNLPVSNSFLLGQ